MAVTDFHIIEDHPRVCGKDPASLKTLDFL